MKLIKYKLPKMVKELAEIDPNYAFVDTVDPTIHNDIHTLRELHYNGEKTGYDYQFVKDTMKALMNQLGGFSALNDDDKRCCAERNCCTPVEAALFLGSEAYDLAIDKVLEKTKKAREKRKENSRKKFGREVAKGELNYTDSAVLFSDLEALAEKYVETGSPEIIDWINSTNTYQAITGKDYTTTGFDSKSYANATRKQYLVDHIINGKVYP